MKETYAAATQSHDRIMMAVVKPFSTEPSNGWPILTAHSTKSITKPVRI